MMKNIECISCGKNNLSNNEIGINKKLLGEDLENFYTNNKVLGLAEIMDYPAVSNLSPDMISKLFSAVNKGLSIDGHGAGLSTRQLNTISAAYIKTDHECHTPEEVTERVRRGM